MSEHKITISGPVEVRWQDENGRESREVTDAAIIRQFDGAIFRDFDLETEEDAVAQLSIYLADGGEVICDNQISGGTLHYEMRQEELWVVYTFSAPRRLDGMELSKLLRFCEEQMTDGAGPIFAAQLEDDHEGNAPLSESDDLCVRQEQIA